VAINKKIVITGGAGFIGYYLAKKLVKNNFQIIIWDNLSRGKYDFYFKNLIKHKNIKFVRKDLSKKITSNIKGIKYIFHCAGSVGVENINQNPLNAFLNNTLACKNVIRFSNKLKEKSKIILFSTSEVYSPLIKKNKVKFPIKEENDILIENKIIPRDSYYLSKIFNEKLVQLSKNDYLIIRPHNIYGPRMGYSHVIPELIKKIFLEKKKITKKSSVFSPQHKRAFCYIDDAIEQIVSLALNPKANNQIFNIGNMTQEIKIIDLAKKIKNLVYKKSNLINGQITKGSPLRRVPNMNKTIKKTKIKKFINLDKGLFQTINWYLNDIKKKYEK
jgi:nucleoside-diphosphate-sugar epimerase